MLKLAEMPDFLRRNQVIELLGWSEAQYARLTKKHNLLVTIPLYKEKRMPKSTVQQLLQGK